MKRFRRLPSAASVRDPSPDRPPVTTGIRYTILLCIRWMGRVSHVRIPSSPF